MQYFATQSNLPLFGVWFLYCAMNSVVDSKIKKLPNSLIASGLLASWLTYLSVELVRPDYVKTLLTLGLTVAVAVLFLIFALITKGAFGYGDVKFAPLCFLLPASLGTIQLLSAVVYAFATAAVFGLLVILLRGGGLKSRLAFGPFMFIGSLLSIF